jgi:hypothetical protein
MRRLLRVDPDTGTAQYVEYDDNDDTFRFVQEVDHLAVADFNRRQYVEPNARFGDGQRVATLPMPLWLKLFQEGVLDDPRRLSAWLNDPDHRDFRTRPGWV